MSGYCGFSMSNNAVDAYRCGEMPLSKWLKSDLIDAIEDVIEDKADIAKFKKLTVKQLKEYFLEDLDRLLTDCNDKVTSLIVADKNKVMLSSIISNDVDNVIRKDTKERAWQIDRYWRDGLSTLPGDYESIKKILYLGFPNETKEYDNESIEKLFNCVIALSFSILETIIKSDNLICCEYED